MCRRMEAYLEVLLGEFIVDVVYSELAASGVAGWSVKSCFFARRYCMFAWVIPGRLGRVAASCIRAAIACGMSVSKDVKTNALRETCHSLRICHEPTRYKPHVNPSSSSLVAHQSRIYARVQIPRSIVSERLSRQTRIENLLAGHGTKLSCVTSSPQSRSGPRARICIRANN